MNDADVLVIGSGAGGLSAALALANAGKRVLVLEQHTLPGGWCHSFDLDGFRFSPGVHYLGELGPTGRLRQVYEGLGIGGDLAFYELDPDGIDQVHIGSGPEHFVFRMPKGREALIERLAETFPDDAAGLRLLVARFGAMSRAIGSLSDAPHPVIAALGSPVLVRHALRPVGPMIDRHVNDPRAKAVLCALAGDHGMPPASCPTVLHAAVMGHYAEGAWSPRGGARALPKAFLKGLRRAGGAIEVGARVERILTEGRKVLGVRLTDGREIRADVVVSNADPHATAALLDPVPWRWRLRLPRLRYSLSAVSLYLAVDMDLDALAARGVGSGNLWLFGDADLDRVMASASSVDPLADGGPAAMFLTCTSAKDPSAKNRQGLTTFEAFAMTTQRPFDAFVGTATGERPAAYEALKERWRDAMLAGIEARIPGFRDRVRFCAVGTPLTNTHYVAASQGAAYGLRKELTQLGPLAFGPSTPFEGLWMCGASTLSHGVAGATLSGLEVAKRVLSVTTSALLAAEGEPITLLSTDRVKALRVAHA